MGEDRKVLIIYTGGTIGMVASPESGSLDPVDLDLLQEQIPELKGMNVELSTISVREPIDSSNMKPSDWQWLARTIADNMDGFNI